MHGCQPPKDWKKRAIAARVFHSTQIIALACRGFRPRQIVREMDGLVNEDTVKNCLNRARRENPDVPRFNKPPRIDLEARADDKFMFRVPVQIAKLLEIEARLRNITTAQLVERLLTVVAEDHMVDAVLDDRAGDNSP